MYKKGEFFVVLEDEYTDRSEEEKATGGRAQYLVKRSRAYVDTPFM